MAAATPSGPDSLALSNLKTLLSNCSAFQTWVGIGQQVQDKPAAALAYIFYIDAASSASRPFAILDIDEGAARNTIALGVSEVRARLRVQFQEAISASAVDDGDAYIRFANSIGAIVAQISSLGGSGGYLNVLSVTRSGKPGRPELPEGVTTDDFYWDEYIVEYMGA